MTSEPFPTVSSRRAFIVGAAAGTAILGAGSASAFVRAADVGRPGLSGLRSVDLATAGLDGWAREVGSDFAVETEHGLLTLRLVAVEAGRHSGPHAAEGVRARAFTAIFGGAAPGSGDRTYKVRHPVSGALSVYFGPAGDTGRISAVFA